MQLSKIDQVLDCLDMPLNTEFDLIEASRRGVKKCSLLNLAKRMGITSARLSAMLSISERTIQRKHEDEPFNRLVSEQVLKLAEIYARGEEVFEETDRFLGWLNHPSQALGGKVPMDLLDSAYGRQIVLHELTRIEHGILA